MLKILRMIHFTAGLVGAVIILIMSITGLLLNHRSLIGYSSDTSIGLQKLVFAVHSSRIGNVSVVWLTDLGAVCMIVLTITGLWMWLKMIIHKRHTRKGTSK